MRVIRDIYNAYEWRKRAYPQAKIGLRIGSPFAYEPNHEMTQRFGRALTTFFNDNTIDKSISFETIEIDVISNGKKMCENLGLALQHVGIHVTNIEIMTVYVIAFMQRAINQATGETEYGQAFYIIEDVLGSNLYNAHDRHVRLADLINAIRMYNEQGSLEGMVVGIGEQNGSGVDVNRRHKVEEALRTEMLPFNVPIVWE